MAVKSPNAVNREAESAGAGRTRSRRDFLKATSVGASAAAVSWLSIARGAHAAGDDTIKLGMIGCGGRGSGAAFEHGRRTARGAVPRRRDRAIMPYHSCARLNRKDRPDRSVLPLSTRFFEHLNAPKGPRTHAMSPSLRE